jgi:DNA-binding CsgD family transcriptional regulator
MRILTEREKNVAQLAAEGFTISRIAQKLGISHAGVNNTLARVYKLLGVHNRVQLAMAWQQQQSLLSIEHLREAKRIMSMTGRMPQQEPNLQNIPQRTLLGNEIKKAWFSEVQDG